MDGNDSEKPEDLTTVTHRVSRISTHPAMDRILFNRLGRSLEFEPGSPEAPGAAVEVPALVAAIAIGATEEPSAESDSPANWRSLSALFFLAWRRSMTIETTLLEQAYVKEESAYATLATPGSTDAFRHQELALKKNNREPSPQKSRHAGSDPVAPARRHRRLGPRRGVLGTERHPRHAERTCAASSRTGSARTRSAHLATTVAAMPAPTTTSAHADVERDRPPGRRPRSSSRSASGARREITRIKTVAGAAITFDALSAAPDTPGAFVVGVTTTSRRSCRRRCRSSSSTPPAVSRKR
jgi:hypothetical protein